METDTEHAAPITTLDSAPEWIRADLACYFVGGGKPISRRTLDRLIGRKRLRASKPCGRVVLVHRDSIRTFLEERAA